MCTQSASCVGLTDQTTLHILNGCPEAPNQSRWLWHHDFVLNYPSVFHEQTSFDDYNHLADLMGNQASKNHQATIPVDSSVSKAKLDMVLKERGKDTAYMYSGTHCVLQYMWIWRSKIKENPKAFILSAYIRPRMQGSTSCLYCFGKWYIRSSLATSC